MLLLLFARIAVGLAVTVTVTVTVRFGPGTIKLEAANSRRAASASGDDAHRLERQLCKRGRFRRLQPSRACMPSTIDSGIEPTSLMNRIHYSWALMDTQTTQGNSRQLLRPYSG
jgi:hypothetical protein